MTQPEWRPEFAHVAVLVSDVERSAAWYHDVLGWEPVFAAEQGPVLGEGNGHGGPGSIAMGRVGATNVELVAMHEPSLGRWQRSDRYGLMLISVRVPEIRVARARCEAHGVTISREVAFGPTVLLVVADPDGTEIGIVGAA